MGSEMCIRDSGDIRASLLSRTISTGTCVISPRFLGVLWYCCTVFRRTDVPIGRCTAFWSCRCGFTYHMVCTSTSFTVPSWYRPIGEIAPGCLLSAAALPGKAVRSIYQFSIAPTGEMAPGIIAPVCVRWHPSVRWHRGGPKNTRKKYLEVFYEKF